MTVDIKDFVAYQIGNELVCPLCLTEEERISVTIDDVVTVEDVEDNKQFVFCDRCKQWLY